MTQKQEDTGASLRDRAASLRPQPAAQASRSGITGAARNAILTFIVGTALVYAGLWSWFQ